MKSFTLIALLFSGFTFLTSCQKDEVAPSGDQSPFVGTYAVAETSSTIPASNYAITISQSAGQPNTIEIGNFGDILKKNVLATTIRRLPLREPANWKAKPSTLPTRCAAGLIGMLPA
jgi:hypothetical protein